MSNSVDPKLRLVLHFILFAYTLVHRQNFVKKVHNDHFDLVS